MGEARIVEGIAMLGEKLLPTAIEDWASSDTGAHFIAAKATSGGGASASQGSRDTGENPYSKEHFSLTEQFRLEKENPQLAKQYQDTKT